MQGTYTYIPETNNVPMEYIVSAILLLLFMVPISLVPALALLWFYVSTFYYYYYYYTGDGERFTILKLKWQHP
jgi:hypothetical protein